jgi:TolA-binding protein
LSKHAEAELVYKRILSEHPASPFALRADYQLCWTAYWQNRYDDAAARAESLAKKVDGELAGEVMFVHGLARFDQARFLDALDQFKAVVAGHPKSKFAPEAQLHHAQCLAELGRHKEAAQAFSRFGSGRPADNLAYEALFNAAQQQFLAGEYTAAAAQFGKIAADSADNTARRSALFMEGRTSQHANRAEAAIEAYAAYLESFPNGPDAAEALYQSGVIWQQQKDTKGAMTAYDKLAAEYPGSPFAVKAQRNLGYIHYDNNEMDKAATALRGLLDGGADVVLRPDTLMWLANYLYDDKDYAAGRQAYEQLANTGLADTKREFARVRTAECALKIGDTAAADAGYRAVIAAAPEGPYSAVAKLGLGRVLLATDRAGEAVEQLERVIEVGDPSAVAEARVLLGDAYTKLDNLDEALRSYMMVAMVYDHPEFSSRCYIKAADTLRKRGDRDREQKLYRDLIAAYPDSADASIARTRLDAGGSSQ